MAREIDKGFSVRNHVGYLISGFHVHLLNLEFWGQQEMLEGNWSLCALKFENQHGKEHQGKTILLTEDWEGISETPWLGQLML